MDTFLPYLPYAGWIAVALIAQRLTENAARQAGGRA
jgi:hypothetical protein